MAIAEKTAKQREASNRVKSNQKKVESSTYASRASGRVARLHQTIGNRALRRLLNTGLIQAKLTIGQPNDIYEQEAERVADTVIKMPDPRLKRQPVIEGKKEMLHPKLMDISQVLSTGGLETQETTGNTLSVSDKLSTQINSIKSSGVPLSKSERNFFEPRFGHDFNQVRVHTNTPANEIAREINAHAFTLGSDIVFGGGQYAPGNSVGRRLLAHELVHVVQQAGNAGYRSISRINTPRLQRACNGQCSGRRPPDTNDPAGCQRQCRGCADENPIEIVRGPTRNHSRVHYKVYYCPDSTQLNPRQNVKQYSGRNYEGEITDEVFCRHIRVRASQRNSFRVFGFASDEVRATSYQNALTAMHRANDMKRRLENYCSASGSEVWTYIENSGVTIEGATPEENRFAWIECWPPRRQPPPSATPRRLDCLGPNPGLHNADCTDRRVALSTGHCTWCPPNYYDCREDVCRSGERLPNFNEYYGPDHESCRQFYLQGQQNSDPACASCRVNPEPRCQNCGVNQRMYEAGQSADPMASCCMCYRMGVDSRY